MNLAELQKQIGVDLVKDVEDLELITKSFDFEFFAADDGKGSILKAYVEKDEDGEDQFYLKGVASSTIKDRHGDTILPSALIDMERTANSNMTVFLNHKYDIPENIGGSVVKASIGSRDTGEDGAPLYDLDFEKMRIDKTNPRAVQSFQSIKGGTKLGFSIGARVPEGGAVRNKKTGALLISHVDLLETSVVGIPANPRSWIDYAVKAYKGEGPEVAIRTDQLTASATTNGTGATNILITTSAIPEVEEVVVTPAQEILAGEDGPELVVPAVDLASSQGAPASEPDADGAVEPPAVEAAAEPDEPIEPDPLVTPSLTQALREAHTSLADVTGQLIDARRAQSDAEQRATKAERELDIVKQMAQDVIRDTAQIIERLGRLPVGQKASFRAIARDFDELPEGLEQIYSPGFMAELRRDPTA
jgi:HK97 family phage prohead protease